MINDHPGVSGSARNAGTARRLLQSTVLGKPVTKGSMTSFAV